MAKPIAGRKPDFMPIDRQIPMIKVDEVPFWAPPRGLQLTQRLSRVPKEFAAAIKNMVLDDGVLRSRFGTVAFGASTTDLMAVAGFITPSQVGYLLRVTKTGIDLWDGSAWASLATSVFTGSTADYFSFTAWGNEVLLCNGVNKIYRYNPETGQKGFLAESYAAKHITTFGGRVVATAVVDGSFLGYRIRWSVKNDNEDWTGDGSGFEDLFAAPGGRIDAAHGCFPISDDTALIIRENSIWQMSLTGIVTAPFRFSRILSEMGTRARRSIAEVPGGYAMVSKDNVVIVGAGEFRPIGDPVRAVLIPSITDPDAVVGEYDHQRSEYRLANGTDVWRYSFRDQGWTRDLYPVQIRDMNRVAFTKLGRTIDSLTGNINALAGTIDGLVTTVAIDGFFMATHEGSSTGLVTNETTSATQDVNTSAVASDSEILAATGLIQAGSVLDESKVIEIQMEYEADAAQDLIFEYSANGGSTWTTYSTKTVAVTTGPTILAVRKTIVGHNTQLRVRSAALGKLRVLSFVPRIVQEAKVNP